MTIRVYCEANKCGFEDKAETEKEAKELGRNHAKQGHVVVIEEADNG